MTAEETTILRQKAYLEQRIYELEKEKIQIDGKIEGLAESLSALNTMLDDEKKRREQ